MIVGGHMFPDKRGYPIWVRSKRLLPHLKLLNQQNLILEKVFWLHYNLFQKKKTSAFPFLQYWSIDYDYAFSQHVEIQVF